MRERLASELVTLGLEVTDVKVSKKKLLPTQETQTDMELLSEQQTAVDTLVNLNQTIQQPEQHILPPEVLNFINSIAKPNTPYHTDDYVFMVEQTTAGDKVLTVQDKSATATNQSLTPLSEQEVSSILNQVPDTSVTQNIQQFAPEIPMLPVPPPDMIPPEQYIPQVDVTNNKQEISAQVHVPTIPSTIPSGSIAKIDIDKDEDTIEVECDVDDDKPTKSNRSHGRPIPTERQNPKRFYCDNCPRSYSRSSDLNKHKVEKCGKVPEYKFQCTMCNSKFLRKVSLREHIWQVHKKEEPYVCDVCNMKFFRGPTFTAHKSLHPGHTFPKKVWDDDL